MLSLLLQAGLSSLLAKEPAKIYEENFNDVAIGSQPKEVMVLEGEFTVREAGGQKSFVLPGEPLGNFGFLFGPRMKPPVTIALGVVAEKKGRRMPRFGLGWGGQNGLKLFANPTTKKLELFDNLTKLGETPLTIWESGTPLYLSMVIWEDNGTWKAKCAATRQPLSLNPPRKPDMFVTEIPTPPRAGRASAWAQPYAGQPIAFTLLTSTNQLSSPLD